jgi:hypothetical protein
MEREEWIEWIALIVVILLWWPLILLHWFPLAYRLFLYVFSAAVLVTITVRRVRRVREGLNYSREIMDSQRRAQGPPPLNPPPEGGRPQ